MIKCFTCIKEEVHEKRKWSRVEEAVCIYGGIGYCYQHLIQECFPIVRTRTIKRKEGMK